jgi:hypothetical protein
MECGKERFLCSFPHPGKSNFLSLAVVFNEIMKEVYARLKEKDNR